MRLDIHQQVRLRLRSAAIVSAVLLALVAGAALTASAQAAVYTVGTVNDLTGTCANPAAGSCSLRQLIEYENKLPATPNPPDTIILPEGTYELSEGELLVKQPLAIVGAGARKTHVDVKEGPFQRVFDIQVPEASEQRLVVLSGMEISGGKNEEIEGPNSRGGDIYNTADLFLIEDLITEGAASSGGGVSNYTGTLFVERSLVYNNHASAGAGDGGGIESIGSATCESACSPGKPATLDVQDSTVAENESFHGAGIMSHTEAGVNDPNQVVLLNSTIADNHPQLGPGAGLLVEQGTAEVAASILAFNVETGGNHTATNCSASPAGAIESLGYNLDSGTDCKFASTGDLHEAEPGFSGAAVTNNGGSTNTYGLEPTSRAVDAIPTSFPFCNGADQRGVTRPQGAGCDIGAVELVPLTIDSTEGSQFSGQVAVSPTCGILEFFTPLIDWGDGLKSVGTFEKGPNGEVTGIRGVHEYAEEGTYKGTVTYENDCGKHEVAFLADVADAPLTASGVPVSGTALVPLTATVATFTDADPIVGVGDYTATIDWGDGTTSAGTIGVAAGGGFTVTGSHAYAAAGQYKTSVTIDDVGGATATATSTADIVNQSSGPPTVLTPSPPTVLSTTSAAFTTTVNPHGLPTAVHFEYGPVLGGKSAAATTYGSVTPDQQVAPDFANHTVTATVTGLLPNVTYNVRAVATNGAGSTLGANQTLQTPADPPPPPPVLGKSVNVKPVSGIVYIELPPGAKLASVSPFAPLSLAAQALAAITKGQTFVPLTEARQIPVGSTLDTRTGVVGITTATTASRHGKLQSGDFGAGLFKLLQSRKQRGLTDLNIIDTHSARQVCTTLGKARIAAAHLSSKVLGRLNASGHGHFTARGTDSAATVRGTIWSVANQCDGTLTKVTRGVVSVRDFHRRKTITLFTGQSYLARAPHA